MFETGKAQTYDGVGVLARGDVCLIVYQHAARLHRTRWLFDRMDEFAGVAPGPFVGLMIVLPTAAPPDAETRHENNVRLKKLGSAYRRIVTAPVGDAFHLSVVRTVMRGLAILQGQAKVQLVANDISDGLRRVVEVASASTPTRNQLVADLRTVHAALGVSMQEISPGAASGTSAA